MEMTDEARVAEAVNAMAVDVESWFEHKRGLGHTGWHDPDMCPHDGIKQLLLLAARNDDWIKVAALAAALQWRLRESRTRHGDDSAK